MPNLARRETTHFHQPKLPFPDTALAPTISAQTIQFHYGKHHAAYYATLNHLVEGTPYAEMPLEEVVVRSAAHPEDNKLFNQAGQAWNHDFYWTILKPNGARKPSGKLAEAIDQEFQSFDKFKSEFAKIANEQFGSGWAWLVRDGGKLKVIGTANGDTPLAHGIEPLATIDVWEHAYYLDYQNKRPDHVKAVIENLINWDIVRELMG